MSEQEQPLCDSANLFYFNAFHNTFVHYIPVKATFIFIVFDLSRPQICLDSQVIGRHPKGIIDNYFNYDTEYLTKLNLSRDLVRHQANLSVSTKVPTIVTATNSKCVSDVMIWIPEIASIKLNTKVVIYDLGMTQLELVKVTSIPLLYISHNHLTQSRTIYKSIL